MLNRYAASATGSPTLRVHLRPPIMNIETATIQRGSRPRYDLRAFKYVKYVILN